MVLFVYFIFYLYGSLWCRCVYGPCCLIQNKWMDGWEIEYKSI